MIPSTQALSDCFYGHVLPSLFKSDMIIAIIVTRLVDKRAKDVIQTLNRKILIPGKKYYIPLTKTRIALGSINFSDENSRDIIPVPYDVGKILTYSTINIEEKIEISKTCFPISHKKTRYEIFRKSIKSFVKIKSPTQDEINTISPYIKHVFRCYNTFDSRVYVPGIIKVIKHSNTYGKSILHVKESRIRNTPLIRALLFIDLIETVSCLGLLSSIKNIMILSTILGDGLMNSLKNIYYNAMIFKSILLDCSWIEEETNFIFATDYIIDCVLVHESGWVCCILEDHGILIGGYKPNLPSQCHMNYMERKALQTGKIVFVNLAHINPNKEGLEHILAGMCSAIVKCHYSRP